MKIWSKFSNVTVRQTRYNKCTVLIVLSGVVANKNRGVDNIASAYIMHVNGDSKAETVGLCGDSLTLEAENAIKEF